MAYSLTVGASVPLRAYGDVASSYTFLSVNPKVASVDAGGNVTAVGPGKVAILMVRKSDLAMRRVLINVKGAATGSTASVVDASGNRVAVVPFVLKVNNKVYGGTQNFKELRALSVPVTPPAALSVPTLVSVVRQSFNASSGKWPYLVTVAAAMQSGDKLRPYLSGTVLADVTPTTSQVNAGQATYVIEVTPSQTNTLGVTRLVRGESLSDPCSGQQLSAPPVPVSFEIQTTGDSDIFNFVWSNAPVGNYTPSTATVDFYVDGVWMDQTMYVNSGSYLTTPGSFLSGQTVTMVVSNLYNYEDHGPTLATAIVP